MQRLARDVTRWATAKRAISAGAPVNIPLNTVKELFGENPRKTKQNKTKTTPPKKILVVFTGRDAPRRVSSIGNNVQRKITIGHEWPLMTLSNDARKK